jgi:glycosyltransferase involved in cell wall biosynthesis
MAAVSGSRRGRVVWPHLTGAESFMTTVGSAPRVLFDATDLMWMTAEGHHPTGIPRVVSECFGPLAESVPNLVAVFFSKLSRAYCEVDSVRLAVRDVAYARKLRPASKDHLGKLYAWFGPLRSGRVVPRPDDTILILGGGWGHGRRQSYLFGPDAPKCRVIWLCHDLIPILYPQFVTEGTTFPQVFGAWLDAALAHGHEFICASRFVEADLRGYTEERGVYPRISVVPLAHEFKPVEGQVRGDILRLAGRKTVLCVNSIGLRKNQIALLRAWHRLHGELGEALPVLVLAGDIIDPAPVEEFLERTANVDGKVAFLGPVTDAELTWLYRACAFTVCPSLNEGWGLSVGESLWMGKPCLSSSLTSLPEVGGAWAVYFDPRDEADMLGVLRQALRGEFAALPPPRAQLRNWRQVGADIARLL